MLGYGRDESAPTPGGVFVTHFVGERNIINNPSVALSQTVSSRREPIYRARIYVFATHSQSVQNTFTECSQRVRYLCVTYSPCKSMVFAPQKYGFWRAKTPFLHCKNPLFGVQEVGFCKALISRWLHCFCVSGRCSNTINVRNRRYS